ncbi:MAG: exodeoxyribonuclease V subunit alpha [Nitriliruptorales bacterium]|nr:exodeoxyribonuclease V subunit alpha [Nitriliruptorales bacterium]
MTTVPADAVTTDPADVRLATDPYPRLAPFNRAGILGPTEVHAAQTLGQLLGESRPDVLLAAALAIRAPRHSHVCLELSRAAETMVAADDSTLQTDELEWPDPDPWRRQIADSALVRVRAHDERPTPDTDRPLSLVGDRLYLDRYWRYERRVAAILRLRAERGGRDIDRASVRPVIDRLLPAGEERPDRQRLAVASALTRSLTVIAGGPGTGKTYTIARLLAGWFELAGDRYPRVAVAAPTGKAADRLTAALRQAARSLETGDEVRARLRTVEASTIHRLLGWSPNPTRFAHDRERQLPHELVVIDETSMVDLPVMAKLLSALRSTATLVLVGDPDQLASVEAGTVLADVVGPSGAGLRFSAPAVEVLRACTGEPLEPASTEQTGAIGDTVVTLGAARRYAPASGIGQLAAAIHAGDPARAIEVLTGDHDDLTWIPPSGEGRPADLATSTELEPVRSALVDVHRDVFSAAAAGEAAGALDHLDRIRVLCAHRHGAAGVSTWVPLVEGWLRDELDAYDPTVRWYLARPLLVTKNLPRLGLFNGDVGIVVRSDDGIAAAFHGSEGVRRLGPSRLEDVETVHAMTIHKSQGSEFDAVVIVLPAEESPILTRELLYTAITRARRHVTVVGSEDVVRAAISRPIARAAGLRQSLWGD